MLAAFVADEDILIAVLFDAVPNLIECSEDDVDVGPVRRARDDQRDALDFRLGGSLTIMLFQKLLGLEDGSRLLRPNAGPRSRCRMKALPVSTS